MSTTQITRVKCDGCGVVGEGEGHPKDWKQIQLAITSYDPDDGWSETRGPKKDYCGECRVGLRATKPVKGRRT